MSDKYVLFRRHSQLPFAIFVLYWSVDKERKETEIELCSLKGPSTPFFLSAIIVSVKFFAIPTDGFVILKNLNFEEERSS